MSDKNIYQQAEIALLTYLRNKGKRCTHERLVILSHICTIGRNFTAENLVKDLCESQHISNATIYNTLSMLCDAHILRILPKRQQQGSEYEISIADKNTLRYVCTRCGREVELKNKAIDHLLQDSRFSNFEMENFSLVVYGHCKTCRRKHK